MKIARKVGKLLAARGRIFTNTTKRKEFLRRKGKYFYPFLFNPFLHRQNEGKFMTVINDSLSGLGVAMSFPLFLLETFFLFEAERIFFLFESEKSFNKKKGVKENILGDFFPQLLSSVDRCRQKLVFQISIWRRNFQLIFCQLSIEENSGLI